MSGEVARSDQAFAALAESDSFDVVATVLKAHCYEPDIEGARAVYAAIMAHNLGSPPVWAMIVAPPGSLKTELLNPLRDAPGVHFVDKVTPNTFLSGQIDDGRRRGLPSPSLLHRIGTSGIIVCPDFSTVISMQRESRASVLADMRRIFDGHLKKEFGTADNPRQKEWRGRITCVVAATPDIDRSYSVFQTLGERFVIIRWHRPGGVEAAELAIRQDAEELKTALRSTVHELLARSRTCLPHLAAKQIERVAALAELGVRGRTHLPRDGYNKQIIYNPEPEAATRLAQQLAQLARGSAYLAGREIITEQDLALVFRVALDCIPASRRTILVALIEGQPASSVKLPASTLLYAKEDLEAQDLLAGDGLSPLASKLLNKAKLIP